MGRSRKNVEIRGRNRSKSESRGYRKKTKRQEEWEEFSHCMMLKISYIRAKFYA